ncbi:MAG TPA: M28 family peptidase [Polyangiaceae bacterium]|nr:M28 family peptidase [Polyangiaceae bacterium]
MNGLPLTNRDHNPPSFSRPAMWPALPWAALLWAALLWAALLASLPGCQSQSKDTQEPTGQTTACSDSSVEGLMACVDPQRYHQDLEHVTGSRPPGSPHWQAVQDLCAERLGALGFTVERQAYEPGVNVIGVLPGSDLASELVLVAAHYDHLDGCPGADDNATGVAGTLEIARVLGQRRYRRSAVAICLDQEERASNGSLGPTLGSRAFTDQARLRGEIITAAFIFDMIGYSRSEPNSQRMPPGLEQAFPGPLQQIADNQHRGDFIMLVADPLSASAVDRFEAHAQALELKAVSLQLHPEQTTAPGLSVLRRSDHGPFWEAGYPAVLLTDTAELRNPHYHCENGPDTIEDLDDAFSVRILGATLGAMVDVLEPE